MHGSTVALFNMVFSGICSGVLIAVTIHNCSQIYQDLAEGRVLTAVGKISLRIMPAKNLRYKIQLGKLELAIPDALYHGLNNGKRYRVYYTPRSRTLVGIVRTY